MLLFREWRATEFPKRCEPLSGISRRSIPEITTKILLMLSGYFLRACLKNNVTRVNGHLLREFC
jgi:hypothetical protein